MVLVVCPPPAAPLRLTVPLKFVTVAFRKSLAVMVAPNGRPTAWGEEIALHSKWSSGVTSNVAFELVTDSELLVIRTEYWPVSLSRTLEMVSAALVAPEIRPPFERLVPSLRHW